MLFDALPEHGDPNRPQRKLGSRRAASANPTSTSPIALEASSANAPHQIEWPFPKARAAAGKFVRDAVQDGMKDAAKKVVAGAIIATGAAAIGAVGFFGLEGVGLRKKAEPPKLMKPWETTVTRESRPQTVRP